jgi:LPS export ABC transporter protein LptC
MILTTRTGSLKFSVWISLSIICLFIYGCDSKNVLQPSLKGIKTEVLPDQQSFNAVVNFTDSGKVIAVLTAGIIKMYYTKNETLLENKVKVEFYNVAGNIEATLTGEKGRIDDVTKDIFIYGNVVVENDSGMVLNTEKLMWRNIDKKIWTDEFVKIKTKTEDIEGYGFESDQSLRNYTIYKVTLQTNASGLGDE